MFGSLLVSSSAKETCKLLCRSRNALFLIILLPNYYVLNNAVMVAYIWCFSSILIPSPWSQSFLAGRILGHIQQHAISNIEVIRVLYCQFRLNLLDSGLLQVYYLFLHSWNPALIFNSVTVNSEPSLRFCWWNRTDLGGWIWKMCQTMGCWWKGLLCILEPSARTPCPGCCCVCWNSKLALSFHIYSYCYLIMFIHSLSGPDVLLLNTGLGNEENQSKIRELLALEVSAASGLVAIHYICLLVYANWIFFAHQFLSFSRWQEHCGKLASRW